MKTGIKNILIWESQINNDVIFVLKVSHGSNEFRVQDWCIILTKNTGSSTASGCAFSAAAADRTHCVNQSSEQSVYC